MTMTVRKLSGSILSPLGFTAGETYDALSEGRTALRLHEGTFGIPEPFTASLFDRDLLMETAAGRDIRGFSLFETACLLSQQDAIREAGINPASPDVIFVLSTIKGNDGGMQTRIGEFWGAAHPVITVSNACISGLAALIHARRLLLEGRYKYAVVTGCEIQTRFIVSGFQSLKALSPEPCRPFDKDRNGLNLGEAAATMVLGLSEDNTLWEIGRGAVRNDANHISGPSRTGEGSFNALRSVLTDCRKEDLAFVNVHGTATLYNDEMESVAIARAGLLETPVNALKGTFGHTMGAAGILETLLSMRALEEGIVLPTRGLHEIGVSHAINASPATRKAHGNCFIKLLSGFGGCNAALLLRKGGEQ